MFSLLEGAPFTTSVARIDSVFRKCLRAIRMVDQQLVSIEVKIADQRHRAVRAIERGADRANGGGSLRRVDRNADELGSSVGKRLDLRDGGSDIGGVRIRHRLDHDRRSAADYDVAYANRPRRMAGDERSLHHRHLSRSRATFARV